MSDRTDIVALDTARDYAAMLESLYSDRSPVVWRWRARLDNYEPSREYGHGYAVKCRNSQGEDTVVIFGYQSLIRPANIVWDTGASAEIYYCTGWHDPATEIGNREVTWFGRFPVNPDGRTRPDNGRVVDYSLWELGPRRTFHLKVSPVAD